MDSSFAWRQLSKHVLIPFSTVAAVAAAPSTSRTAVVAGVGGSAAAVVPAGAAVQRRGWRGRVQRGRTGCSSWCSGAAGQRRGGGAARGGVQAWRWVQWGSSVGEGGEGRVQRRGCSGDMGAAGAPGGCTGAAARVQRVQRGRVRAAPGLRGQRNRAAGTAEQGSGGSGTGMWEQRVRRVQQGRGGQKGQGQRGRAAGAAAQRRGCSGSGCSRAGAGRQGQRGRAAGQGCGGGVGRQVQRSWGGGCSGAGGVAGQQWCGGRQGQRGRGMGTAGAAASACTAAAAWGNGYSDQCSGGVTPRPSTEVAEDALAADDDDPSNFGAGILAGLRFEIPRQHTGLNLVSDPKDLFQGFEMSKHLNLDAIATTAHACKILKAPISSTPPHLPSSVEGSAANACSVRQKDHAHQRAKSSVPVGIRPQSSAATAPPPRAPHIWHPLASKALDEADAHACTRDCGELLMHLILDVEPGDAGVGVHVDLLDQMYRAAEVGEIVNDNGEHGESDGYGRCLYRRAIAAIPLNNSDLRQMHRAAGVVEVTNEGGERDRTSPPKPVSASAIAGTRAGWEAARGDTKGGEARKVLVAEHVHTSQVQFSAPSGHSCGQTADNAPDGPRRGGGGGSGGGMVPARQALRLLQTAGREFHGVGMKLYGTSDIYDRWHEGSGSGAVYGQSVALRAGTARGSDRVRRVEEARVVVIRVDPASAIQSRRKMMSLPDIRCLISGSANMIMRSMGDGRDFCVESTDSFEDKFVFEELGRISGGI
ncbi:hypothetical protein B0H14DRAFT_3140297 [Mycena olivaceomarginata]|nr:hypothetical protein B0H14DRAFT_3140297 [Mycena olivaceomarginata]